MLMKFDSKIDLEVLYDLVWNLLPTNGVIFMKNNIFETLSGVAPVAEWQSD